MAKQALVKVKRRKHRVWPTTKEGVLAHLEVLRKESRDRARACRARKRAKRAKRAAPTSLKNSPIKE